GVRPLGAIVFGRIGDLIGRKYTFLVTSVTMGLSTALIGFLPTYASVGLTATLGFFLSLGVIGASRAYFGPAGFKAYGWRVPFLASFVLLAVSLYIRLKMSESPLFAKLKDRGQVSKNPL